MAEPDFDYKRFVALAQEMAQEVKVLRPLILSIPYEMRKKSPWPSGRNLWETLVWWLHVRWLFLQVIDGLSRDDPWQTKGRPPLTEAEVLARWDENDARISAMLRDWTESDWLQEVDFYADLNRSRRLRAWELAQTHFYRSDDFDWVQVKEDLMHLGYGDDLIALTGNPAAPYRSVEN